MAAPLLANSGPADEALHILTRVPQDSNRKLRDVAATLVA